jgi:hypothetical protein
LTGGKTLNVKAGAAQVPVFLNNASEDAADVERIFAGKTWSEILALR